VLAARATASSGGYYSRDRQEGEARLSRKFVALDEKGSPTKLGTVFFISVDWLWYLAPSKCAAAFSFHYEYLNKNLVVAGTAEVNDHGLVLIGKWTYRAAERRINPVSVLNATPSYAISGLYQHPLSMGVYPVKDSVAHRLFPKNSQR
jgi:hypothetical protein